MQFNTFGALFILYGLIKVLIVLSLTWFIPHDLEKKLSTIEGLNLIVSGDTTLAGRMVEYILLAFGVFSIVHGLALCGAYSHSFERYIESKNLQYSVYTALGVFSILFYSLVLYTPLPISKDPKGTDHYKLYGFAGGLSFLAVPPLWEAFEYLFPILNRMSTEKKMMYMTLGMFTFIGLLGGVYYTIKNLKRPNSTTVVTKKSHERSFSHAT
uniref:Uncharacterized protein n=1 Tax=viral metagenome TaxID=1070528 RepID=A0A6C0BLM2_9ZZZZ